MRRANISRVAENGRTAVDQPVCMVQSVLTNHTRRGGDPSFPVVNPVTFRDLRLAYTHADGTLCTVPLYDKLNFSRRDLDTDMFFVQGGGFPVRHPDHGPLSKITLKGYFSTTLLQVKPAAAGGSFIAEIASEFDLAVDHASTDTFITLYAFDLNGNRYPVGTFSMVEVSGVSSGTDRMVLAR